MSFEFLDDDVTSDVTFIANAKTLDALFAAAAEATTSVMVNNPGAIRPQAVVPVRVAAATLDLLLLRYLEEIVFQKDVAGLLLRPGPLTITRTDTGHRLDGTLLGEPLAPERHELEADVKAVTLAGLRVEETAAGWVAQVTLDV